VAPPTKNAAHLSASTDKFGCTLLSKRDNPIDRSGSLTFGKANYSNGRLFRTLTGSPVPVDKQYSIGMRNKKLQQPINEPLQPFFRNKKPQAPYLQTLVLPRLSSSSDLRIQSATQPSQIAPMTDFRQV